MTVIAWDGKRLAADKQSTNAGYASKVTKIYRVPGGLVGFAGSPFHAAALLEWFLEGRKPEAWPKPYDPESFADAIFVTTDGRVYEYCGSRGPYPELNESPFGAWGCGRDYALAAIHLGHDARQAVEVACALDTRCGQGVDVLELKGGAA